MRKDYNSINREKNYTRIMTAYGLIFIGVFEKKESALYKGKIMDIITDIAVIDENAHDCLYHEPLDARYINYECDWLPDAIDAFLYWISIEKPNAFDIEKIVASSLCAHNALFYDRIRRKKERDAIEKDMRALAIEYSVKANEFENWLKARGLFLYNGYEKAFVLIMNENNTRAFSFMDAIQQENVMELIEAGKIDGAKIIYSFPAMNTACYNGIWYKMANFDAIKKEIEKALSGGK